MSAINITVPVDSEIEAQAQEVFTSLGLDMTTAINIFLRQAIRQHGLPFEETAKTVKKRPKLGGWEGKIWMAEDFDAPLEEFAEPVPKVPKPGCMRGRIWMAEDFDVPLEEFKEYM